MSKILLLAAFGAVVFIGLTAALVVAPSATRYLERRERIQECMDPYRDHPKFAGQWQQAFLRRLCEMKVGDE